MDISVILHPIMMLFLAIFIGFLSVKTGYLQEENRKVISTLVVKITLPLMIVTSLLEKEVTKDTLGNMVLAAGSAVAIMIILGIIGYGTAFLFRLKEPTRTIHAILSGGGNVGFLGYPVAVAAFGEEALLYAVIYATVNDTLFWTLGLYLMNYSCGKVSGKEALKKLFNPCSIAFFIALPLLFFGVKLPPLLHETLSGIGSLTTYLSMIFIGMTLATIDIRQIYKRVSFLAPAMIKMVIAPIVVAMLFISLGVNHMVAGVIALEIAMPAQTMTSMVASEIHSDETYAAEYIFFSTVLCLITLPFVYYVMNRVVGNF